MNRRSDTFDTPHTVAPADAAPPASNGSALERRTFLAGLTGLAAAGVLAACGGSDDDSEADSSGSGGSENSGSDDADFSDGSQPGGGEYIIVQRIPDGILVPGEVRYPLQLSQNAVFVNDGPELLGAQLATIDGEPMGERLTAKRRTLTPDNYYAFRMTIDEPGIYRLIVEGGPTDGVAFTIADPASVAIDTPGQLLPGFDTPTVDEGGGVDPVCTRDPFCEFHSVTLTEALRTGKSVAYVVGTPAFCPTGTCGPGLEALVSVMPDYADTTVAVHSEVYTDLTATELTPAMLATRLSFEPVVYVTRPDGTIVDRLDGLWNDEELREALDRGLA